MEQTRRLLALAAALLMILLCFASWRTAPRPVVEFLASEAFLRTLRQRNPEQTLLAVQMRVGRRDLDGATLRALLARLDETERTGTRADACSAAGVRGWLFQQAGYPHRALLYLNEALNGSSVPIERDRLLWQKAVVQLRLRDRGGLASSVRFLEDLGYEDDDLASFQAFLRPSVSPLASGKILLWVILWAVLFLVPFWLLNRERKGFLKKFSVGPERIRAFFSFRRSPMSVFLCLVSALLVYVTRLPAHLGIPAGTSMWFVLFHFLGAWMLVLWVHFKLDQDVRGTGWSYGAFLLTFVRFNLLMGFFPLVCLIAALLVRVMAQNLPMWAVNAPVSLGASFPAFAGCMLLLAPWAIPLLFGFSRWPAEELPASMREAPFRLYVWKLGKSGIFNAFSFGYLSPSRAIVATSPLVYEFPDADIEAIMAHEEAHLREGHVFLYFLAMFNAILVVGCAAAYYPAEMQRALLAGPSALQLIGVGVGFLLFGGYLRSLSWRVEYAADAWAADRVGREPYLKALSRLTEANFQPAQIRESENRTSHPSLAQRREKLRQRDGTCFEPRQKPTLTVLAALWRSRLAIEWKHGEAEAIEVASLDDDLTKIEEPQRLRRLAQRHAEFGAECLLHHDQRRLEILTCAQKAAAQTVDPPLPADQICSICSGAMKHNLGFPCAWQGAEAGCELRLSANPVEGNPPAAPAPAPDAPGA